MSSDYVPWSDRTIARIKTFCAVEDRPISSVYREASEGKIRLVKLDGRTYVDLVHWRQRIASLPVAYIRPAKLAA